MIKATMTAILLLAGLSSNAAIECLEEDVDGKRIRVEVRTTGQFQDVFALSLDAEIKPNLTYGYPNFYGDSAEECFSNPNQVCLLYYKETGPNPAIRLEVTDHEETKVCFWEPQ